jgi:hypothetical protein
VGILAFFEKVASEIKDAFVHLTSQPQWSTKQLQEVKQEM